VRFRLPLLSGPLFGDEAAYAKVLDELQKTGPVPALWAKAFAETNGDEKATKALYLRLRVAQVLKQQKIAAAQASEEARQVARAHRARERGPSATWLYVVIGFFVIVTALSGIFASMYL
jgi:hypothetical protein